MCHKLVGGVWQKSIGKNKITLPEFLWWNMTRSYAIFNKNKFTTVPSVDGE